VAIPEYYRDGFLMNQNQHIQTGDLVIHKTIQSGFIILILLFSIGFATGNPDGPPDPDKQIAGQNGSRVNDVPGNVSATIFNSASINPGMIEFFIPLPVNMKEPGSGNNPEVPGHLSDQVSMIGSPAGPAAGGIVSTSPANSAISGIGIFRGGTWILDPNYNYAWDGGITDIYSTLGQAGDIKAVGDWNGDGKKEIGVFRNGFWILDYNGNCNWDGPSVDKLSGFGQAGDIPVIGDWNGNGKDKIGVFRNGFWIIDNNGDFQWSGTGSGADIVAGFGQSGDVPVVGNWNHALSATDKIGVFRNGQWLMDYDGSNSWSGSDKTAYIGQPGDFPVTGDWNGDGNKKIGVFRNGAWVLDYNGNYQWDGITGGNPDKAANFGQSGDVPVFADWNSDTRDNIGIFRNGIWIIDYNGDWDWDGTATDRVAAFGQAGDIPVTGSWRVADTGYVTSFSNDVENYIFMYINQLRTSQGLPSYTRNWKYDDIARRHSIDIIVRNYSFSGYPYPHLDPDGRYAEDRADLYGYPSTKTIPPYLPVHFIGENIAMRGSSENAQQMGQFIVLDPAYGWVSDEGHYAPMIDVPPHTPFNGGTISYQITQVGIGVARQPGTNTYWATADFF
jgi:uncharacterized protein YkwD